MNARVSAGGPGVARAPPPCSHTIARGGAGLGSYIASVLTQRVFCLCNKAPETSALVQDTSLQEAPSGFGQPLRAHYCKTSSLIENTASQKASPGG